MTESTEKPVATSEYLNRRCLSEDERRAADAKKPFNKMTMADVATLEADRLADLVEWADQNRERIANITTMGDQIEAYGRTTNHLRALATAARERLVKVNLDHQQRMHDRLVGAE